MHYRSLVVRAVALAAPVLSMVAVFACSETTTTTNNGGSTSGEPNKDLPNSGIAQNDGTSTSGNPGTSSGAGTSGGTSGGPTGPTVNLATYATAAANQYCDFYQRCHPSFITHTFGTLNDCKTRIAALASGQWKADALFDEAAVTAATTCVTNISCDAKYGAVWSVKCEMPKPVNLLADNAKCSDNDHCKSGNCNGLTEAACGVCKPSVTVGVGLACGGDAVCGKGLSCIAGKCFQARGLGETCNTTGGLQCGPGLNCNTTSGLCEKGGVVSDSCPTGTSCDVFQDAMCKSSTDTCVAVTFAGLDQTCGRFGEGPQCDVGLYCKVDSDAGLPTDIGVCKPRVADGQPCQSSTECREFANCRNNICVVAGTDRPTCN